MLCRKRHAAVAGFLACLLVAFSVPSQGFVVPTISGSFVVMQSRARCSAEARGRFGCALSSAVGVHMSGEVMPKKKVVVTGIGAVSSIGTGPEQFFENLMAGKSGISKLPDWANDYKCTIAGLLPDFKPQEWYANKKEANRQSRYMQLAIAASKTGMKDANLEPANVKDPSRFGILIGTAIGGSEFYEEAAMKWEKHSSYDNVPKGESWGDASFAGRYGIFKGPEHLKESTFTFEGFKKISPFIVPAFIMNSGSGVAAVELNAQGPNYCIGGYGGEATGGALSIGRAYKFLSSGQSDIIIAGGSEACLTPACVAGFDKLDDVVKTSNDAPTKSCRPFDKSHSGFVIGEGSGVLVLETEEHALERGAKIICEVAGFGTAFGMKQENDLGLMAIPTEQALAQAIKVALDTSNTKPADVGYVCAHGSGVPSHDRTETAALKIAFGDHAKKLKLSGIKGQLGHTLAASSGFEAAVCANAMKDGSVPGTANLESLDSECDLDYMSASAKISDLKAAVSTSMGYGGQATCLVFKKYSS